MDIHSQDGHRWSRPTSSSPKKRFWINACRTISAALVLSVQAWSERAVAQQNNLQGEGGSNIENASTNSSDSDLANIKQAWDVTVECIKRSKANALIPELELDQKTGKVKLAYQQFPIPLTEIVFSVGDIDPAKINLEARTPYAGYSLLLSAAENAELINSTSYANGKQHETKHQRAFVLYFDSLTDAEKVSRAVAFLAREFAVRGLKPTAPKLEGIPLLKQLLSKSQVQVTVDGNDLKFEAHLDPQGRPQLFYTVHVDDLNPDSFKWTKTGESWSTLELGCKGTGKPVDVFVASRSTRTNIDVVKLAIINERDAGQVADLIKDLCVDRGWKSSGF